MSAWTGAAYGLVTRQPSRPPRDPRSRPPVTPPRLSCCISCDRRRPSVTAASTRSSSISTSSGSTTSGAIDTDCTSPLPVTTTFTMPPPAEPSTVASASASCAAAMSACIFCICFIIWFIWPPPPPGIGGRPPWPFAIVFLVSVAGDFLDDGGAEALRDARPRNSRRHPAVLVDQFGEVDLVFGWRFLVDRRGRHVVVAPRRGVEAVVRD